MQPPADDQPVPSRRAGGGHRNAKGRTSGGASGSGSRGGSRGASRDRLDRILVARGLASTRQKARAMILAGEVEHAGRRDLKPGMTLDSDTPIRIVPRGPERVGRGGGKLEGALDHFALDVSGRRALDVGASVGGFTEVLLRRGARSVIALDVGKGQLDWSLRNDSRVIPFEGVNARHLQAADLPSGGGPVDLVVCDVSFISLRLILPAIARVLFAGPAREDRDALVLVKPQFEAGRNEVGRGGIIRDASVRERTVRDVATAAGEAEFAVLAACESPVRGAEGNVEYFLHLRLGVPAGPRPGLEESIRRLFDGAPDGETA